MNNLTISDIRQAIWDKRFQELFPEYQERIQQFIKDPGCACHTPFLHTFFQHKDRLKKYFPTKNIVLPEIRNDWSVLNCHIEEADKNLKSYPKTKRMIAAARWQNQLTVILNDIQPVILSAPSWRVINTTTEDLLHELKKLPNEYRMFTLTRWQNYVTLIVS